MDHIKNSFNELGISIKWDAGNGEKLDIQTIGPGSNVDIDLSSSEIIKISKENDDWPSIAVTCAPHSVGFNINAQGCSNCCNFNNNKCCLGEIIKNKSPRCKVGAYGNDKWEIIPNTDVNAFCLSICLLISAVDPDATITIG